MRSISLIFAAIVWCNIPAAAQSASSKLEGMWSDPLSTVVGTLCFFSCMDLGIERLNKLLDDPANDSLPTMQLLTQAKTAEREFIKARLTPEAIKHYPLDPLKDPGYLQCEPWGLARQMFAPHQFEVRQTGKDRIELRYGEWAARRTIYMDRQTIPANIKPSRLGYSVGHWEGDTLVVETAGIQANIVNLSTGIGADNGLTMHSDQFRTMERFTRSPDGKVLLLTATLEDPLTFREPIVLKKMWAWAPDQKIGPYDSCEKPSESGKGAKR
jgi:hypothetical protein